MDTERVRDEALGRVADEVLRLALVDTRIGSIKANTGVIGLKVLIGEFGQGPVLGSGGRDHERHLFGWEARVRALPFACKT